MCTKNNRNFVVGQDDGPTALQSSFKADFLGCDRVDIIVMNGTNLMRLGSNIGFTQNTDRKTVTLTNSNVFIGGEGVTFIVSSFCD